MCCTRAWCRVYFPGVVTKIYQKGLVDMKDGGGEETDELEVVLVLMGEEEDPNEEEVLIGC